MQNNQPYPSGTGNSLWFPPTGTTWPTLTDDGPPPLAPRPTPMSLSNGRPSVGGTNYPMGQAQYGHETQPNQLCASFQLPTYYGTKDSPPPLLAPTSEVRRPPHSSAAASLGPIRTHSAGVTHRAPGPYHDARRGVPERLTPGENMTPSDSPAPSEQFVPSNAVSQSSWSSDLTSPHPREETLVCIRENVRAHLQQADDSPNRHEYLVQLARPLLQVSFFGHRDMKA